MQPNNTDFVTVWRMAAGDSFNPALAATWLGGELIVDYGDGCIDKIKDKRDAGYHKYTEDGDYELRLSSNLTSFFPSEFTYSAKTYVRQLIDIKQWGVAQWGRGVGGRMEHMFFQCSRMTMSATDAPDLSRVTDTSGMFAYCHKLNSPINHWNVDNIANASGMLMKTPAFDQDMSNWVQLSNKPNKINKSTDFNNFGYQIFGSEKTIDEYMENYHAKRDRDDMMSILK